MLSNAIVGDLNELRFRLRLRFGYVPDDINSVDGELDESV